jgi:uncharacterized protein (TIGR02444 family)
MNLPDAAELEHDNELWRFSLAVYATPGVSSECLALQDSLGVDVNLLLFCAWLGAVRRIALTDAELKVACRIVQPWHDKAVRPLRAVRRELKAFVGIDFEMLRARVKALELEAEQLELAILFRHALETWPRVSSRDPRADVPANLGTYLQLRGNSSPPAGEVLSIEHLVNAALQFDRLAG